MKNFVTDLHIPKPFERNEYINSYDSLLTLYHGIKHHHRVRGSCHWIGKAPIYATLHKVGLSTTSSPCGFISMTYPPGLAMTLFPIHYSFSGVKLMFLTKMTGSLKCKESSFLMSYPFLENRLNLLNIVSLF